MENDHSPMNRNLLLLLFFSLFLNIILLVFIARHFQITVGLKPNVLFLPTPTPVVNAEPPAPVSTPFDAPGMKTHKVMEAPAYGVQAFPPSTNTSSRLTWSTQAPMPTARDRFAAGEINGVLYYVGGQNNTGNKVTAVEAYRPGSNTWTADLAPLPVGREDLSVAVVDGILYTIGGFDGARVYDRVEAYNPDRNSWSAMAPMPTARCNMGVGVVKGIIYAVGGTTPRACPSTPWKPITRRRIVGARWPTCPRHAPN